jgi:hypothetical protein
MFIATTATTVTKLRRSEILSRSYGAEFMLVPWCYKHLAPNGAAAGKTSDDR